ncbi:hypothetical protein QQF64_034124 [Cirrhinus molitorella]|uniref:HAT C-terminal dimerisation domain-containing protein n=1 Tax=Cirrhinus molitorella TaxID=172907 RepID=A0ABR3MVY8_9TELE
MKTGCSLLIGPVCTNHIFPAPYKVSADPPPARQLLKKMSILKYFKKREGKDTSEDRDSRPILSNVSEEQRQDHENEHDKDDIETVKRRKVINDDKERNEDGAGERTEDGLGKPPETRRAEVKMAATMVQHNIPLAFSDHLSPLLKECFPDSQIAQRYSSARTKTSAIINKCIAPYLMNEQVKNLCSQPFTLATDGSNDTGCPCHIAHNNAHAGGLVYSEISGFDVEDFCIDVAYWFKSSTKRKNMLDEFCVFCDTKYMEVLQHLGVRWLSLDLAVNRILRLYSALKSYFTSTDEKQARFVRLRARFEDPMTEVHLLCYQSLLPTFIEFNLLFQRLDPCLHLLHGQMRSFIRKLMSKFLKPAAFKIISLETVDLLGQENQLPDLQLCLGLTTKATLRGLHEAGDIPSSDVDKFYKAARGFLVRSTEYALTKLPLREPLLSHAQFVDFRQRLDSKLDDVLYFVQRYSHHLPFGDAREQDHLGEEFFDFQMLEDTDIPEKVWKTALVKVAGEKEFHRMDIIWAHLSGMRSRVTSELRFQRLSKVAQLVLCLPHSNADSERIFSAIGLNKTETRISCR